jgi:hypothetical protein
MTTIDDNKKKFADALTNYYTAYNTYNISCVNTKKPDGNCKDIYNNLTEQQNNANVLLQSIYLQLTKDSDDPDYIDANFKKNNDLRKLLESKLNDLNSTYSLLNDSTKKTDDSLLSGSVWTILVTSLLYFLFVKL